MQVIRKIVDLDRLRSMIDIPQNFNYPKVEILILPATEKTLKTKEDFIPETFYGVSSIKNVEQAIQEMHDEWKRI